MNNCNVTRRCNEHLTARPNLAAPEPNSLSNIAELGVTFKSRELLKMEDSKHTLGKIGIVVGGVALLIALFHFWAGPFSPQPTIDSYVAEKAASIRQKTIDALAGKEVRAESFSVNYDADKIVDILTALLGGVACILGILSFAKRESIRFAGGAAALGVSAIAFQFIAMFAMALLVVILIAAVLSSLGA